MAPFKRGLVSALPKTLVLNKSRSLFCRQNRKISHRPQGFLYLGWPPLFCNPQWGLAHRWNRCCQPLSREHPTAPVRHHATPVGGCGPREGAGPWLIQGPVPSLFFCQSPVFIQFWRIFVHNHQHLVLRFPKVAESFSSPQHKKRQKKSYQCGPFSYKAGFHADPCKKGAKDLFVSPDSSVISSQASSDTVSCASETSQISQITGVTNSANFSFPVQFSGENSKPTSVCINNVRASTFQPNFKKIRYALDLFSGKGSVRKALEEHGFSVVSVDIHPRFGPTHISDIMNWNYWQYSPGFFTVISASPPCTEYSRAKTVGWRRFEASDRLVQKTLEIVEFFKPKLWWLENPRTGFLVRRNCVYNLPFIDVDYCQFTDWGYQKPTRIWGSQNLSLLADKVCDGQTCSQMILGRNGFWRHRERLGGRGMKFGTYQKWRIPEKLVSYLLTVLEHNEEKFSYKRENYSVRNDIVLQIENRFQIKADRDCFATARNSLCTAFFTKNDDALQGEWGEGETLWLNPPWSLCRKVTAKLKKSRCTAICILPAWQRGWIRELLRISSQKMYFPAGSRIFEADGRPMGPTKWGVWALLIQRGGSPKLKEGGASPPENPQSVTLKARMFRHTYPRSGTRKFSKDRQLLIRTDAILLNGECRSLKVLVDTGAEANLVRQGLLPEHLTYPATKPLRFETANGQALGGGNVCTRLKLKLISE